MGEGKIDIDVVSKFDLKDVGSYVVNRVKRYDDLDLPGEKKDKIFLEVLSRSLSLGKIQKTAYEGAYINIYHPKYRGKELPLAVKIFKGEDNSKAFEGLKYWLEHGDLKEFQQTLDDSGLVLLNGKNKKDFHELNDNEKLLVVSAWEHQKHEELYKPYVMPAVFISFISREDVLSSEPVVPEDKREVEKGWLYFAERKAKELEEKGRLSKDGREIYIKKGQVLYAMVQNFVKDLSPSVSSLPGDYPVTEKMIEQIEDFTEKVDKVMKNTGFCLDPSVRYGSSNLRFTKDGKLLLIDTNSLRKMGELNWEEELIVPGLRQLAKDLRKRLVV